ncbi:MULTISPECIES: DUF2637 domain-containing protein [unclassified Streptomyces]|uniref:DUF2637 domain-containing protein n=1 Tax=unclassified Streptomyces TaxID=2593676 RepID=UPI000DAE9DED|nr:MULTISPECIES: DUF2637 domain-containing protein [unclassified Streptomyces]PZT74500.1 hypothetical protein DNK55_20590 [Streptomyces sp. AC1-42T]PZT82514.1 hypothetical protein DNK56_10855 [Streptomyces sp. AC1-42W]
MTTTLEPTTSAPALAGPAPASGARPAASTTRHEPSGTRPGNTFPAPSAPAAGTARDDTASGTRPAASATPADASGTPATGPGRGTKVALGVASVVGGLVMGAAGFYLSFGNLSTAGHTVFGFSADDARIFAVGVDVAIVTCLVLDLFMAAIRTGWPLLRLLAHLMTGASIYFNAKAHGAILDHVDKAASHGLMPILFVIGVEAGRRILVHQAALPADHDVIPGHRWLLAPLPTWRIFKQMKVWGEPYSAVVARQRRRAVFDAWTEYKAEVAKAGLEQGSEEALARLPKKLAPFGLTVDEALALPDEMAREELRRQQEQERRDRELELEKERAEHQAAKERVAHRKEMAALNADLSATEGVAGAQARGAIAEAEARADRQARAASALTEAMESKEAAEARERAAEATARAVEADARAAEAEADKTAALARTKAERARVLEAEQRAAEAEAGVAEAQRRAAEARDAAAQILRRAIEAEDAANLTPRQRRVRIVARLILAKSPEDVSLDEVAAAIGVTSGSTASTTKADAVALIEAGYDPARGIDPEVTARH